MGQVFTFPFQKPPPLIEDMEKADWGMGDLETRAANFRGAMNKMKDSVGYIGCTKEEDVQLNRVWDAMTLIQEHLSKMRNRKYAQIARARMQGAG